MSSLWIQFIMVVTVTIATSLEVNAIRLPGVLWAVERVAQSVAGRKKVDNPSRSKSPRVRMPRNERNGDQAPHPTPSNQNLERKFREMMELARTVSRNCLTEIPPSRLRDAGARVVSLFSDVVDPLISEVGPTEAAATLRGSRLLRSIRDAREDWTALLDQADPTLQAQAQQAASRINELDQFLRALNGT